MEININISKNGKIWILKLFNNSIFSKKLTVLLHFIFLLIIFAPFIYIRWQTILKFELNLILALSLGIIWYAISPFLLTRYDDIYERFWRDSQSIIANKNIVKELKEKFDLKIIKLSKYISPLWCPLLLSVIFINPKYLTQLGFGIWSDPYFYIFLVALAYVLHLTSIGFTGAIITIQIIVFFIKNNLTKFNPYSTDNVGGYSCFGNFSFYTTLIFSSGMFFIPILFDYSVNSGVAIQIIISFAVVIYSISIFLLFLLPTSFAFKKAATEKEKVIIELSEEYKKLFSSSDKSIYKELRIHNLMSNINFVKNLSTYPFNFNVMLKLTLTSLLPAIIYVLQLIVNKDSIIYKWKEVIAQMMS